MDAVASRIADLQSSFHGAGARSVIVYFDDLHEGYDQAMGGLHKISTHQVDLIVAKRHQSAFEETTFADELRARGISHLLLSGFYADMCVTRTGIGALKEGFQTAVMLDLTRAVKHFRPIHDLTSTFHFHGVVTTTSDDALSWIQGTRSPVVF
jgi:nicotinamidase-related amidase